MRHFFVIVIYITLAFGLIEAQEISTQVFYDCQNLEYTSAPPKSNLFRPLNIEERGLLFRTMRECGLWLQIPVIVNADSIFAMQIQYPTLDWVQLWIDGKPQKALGSSLPFREGNSSTHLPSWVFSLAPGNHVLHLWVRDNTGQRHVPYYLRSFGPWTMHLEHEALLNGILIGLLMLNVLVAVVLAIIVGKQIDGWIYACFVLFTTTYLLVSSGHAFPILWPNYPWINAFIQLQCAILASALLVLWIMRYQDAQVYSPRWSRLNISVFILLIIPTLFLPLCHSKTLGATVQKIRQIGFLDSIAVFLLVSALLQTIWLAWKKGRKESWSLLVSLILPIGIMIVSFIHDLGYINIAVPNRLHLLEIAAVLLFTTVSGTLALRLKRRLEETTELEHRFSTTVVQTAEREQERIARELHDDIGQRLVALQYQLYSEDSPKAAAEIREILKNLRNLAHGLHPALLINGQLGEALEIWAKDFEAKGICKIQISMDSQIAKIRGEYALHLLRIFQECTSNALRHGQASQIGIFGTISGSNARIRITNNGSPMSMETVEGLGFTSIRARLRLMGGTLDITRTSENETGPELVLQFPI